MHAQKHEPIFTCHLRVLTWLDGRGTATGMDMATGTGKGTATRTRRWYEMTPRNEAKIATHGII
jgi:ABC-type uncharacterized transport system ATPase subunit